MQGSRVQGFKGVQGYELRNWFGLVGLGLYFWTKARRKRNDESVCVCVYVVDKEQLLLRLSVEQPGEEGGKKQMGAVTKHMVMR